MGRSERVSFESASALELSFDDGRFDLVLPLDPDFEMPRELVPPRMPYVA
jgi:hypothetical protein